MARKRELANKLTQQGEAPAARPGWRDAISGPMREDVSRGEDVSPGEGVSRGEDVASEETARREEARRDAERAEEEARKAARRQRSNPLQRKTYLLTPELIEHIASLAETERVGINELVRFLLRSSLEMVENDVLQIPTRPARRQIVRGE